MKLTSRDKELVILAVSLGIVAASWFGGARFINKKTAEVAAQRDELQSEYDERIKILAKKDEYLEATRTYNEAYQLMLTRYPAGISQEKQIMFAVGLEEQFHTQLVSVSYSEEMLKYTFQSVEPDNSVPYNLVSSDMEIPVTLSYSDWKAFLDYIFSCQDKSTIPSLAATFDPLTGEVTANVSMVQFAVTGEDRVLEDPVITVPIGTDNIFRSGTALSYDGGAAEQKEQIKREYDCYVMLYPAASDVTAKVVAGQGETEKAVSESNEEEALEIKAQDQADGTVSVTYTLGKNKPHVLYGLDKETIDIYVLSTQRTGSTDLSGVKVQIDNQTSRKMRIAVSGDDGVRPRFAVESQNGDVQILR